jgi:hypothetical protein
MVWILYQIPFDPIGAYWLPILAAIAITIFVHLEQAITKQTNWTMPKPWCWNSFGFYHALFMMVNLTLALFFIGQLIEQWSFVMADNRLTTGLLLVLAGWLVILLFFFLDRRTTTVTRFTQSK